MGERGEYRDDEPHSWWDWLKHPSDAVLIVAIMCAVFGSFGLLMLVVEFIRRF